MSPARGADRPGNNKKGASVFIDHILVGPVTKTGILYMPPDPLACLEKALSSRVKRSEGGGKKQ